MPPFTIIGGLPMLIAVMATSTSASWRRHQPLGLMWSNDPMPPHRFVLTVHEFIEITTRLKLQYF